MSCGKTWSNVQVRLATSADQYFRGFHHLHASVRLPDHVKGARVFLLNPELIYENDLVVKSRF